MYREDVGDSVDRLIYILTLYFSTLFHFLLGVSIV